MNRPIRRIEGAIVVGFFVLMAAVLLGAIILNSDDEPTIVPTFLAVYVDLDIAQRVHREAVASGAYPTCKELLDQWPTQALDLPGDWVLCDADVAVK